MVPSNLGSISSALRKDVMCYLGLWVCQNYGGAGVSLRCAGMASGLRKRNTV